MIIYLLHIFFCRGGNFLTLLTILQPTCTGTYVLISLASAVNVSVVINVCALINSRNNPQHEGREKTVFEEIPFVKEEWAKKYVENNILCTNFLAQNTRIWYCTQWGSCYKPVMSCEQTRGRLLHAIFVTVWQAHVVLSTILYACIAALRVSSLDMMGVSVYFWYLSSLNTFTVSSFNVNAAKSYQCRDIQSLQSYWL